LADRPYPSHWNRELILRDGSRVPVRPIRPDDESKLLQLLQSVSKEDLRLRFFDSIKEFSHEFLVKLTQLDYSRAMAFVALGETADVIIGVVRLHRDATYENGEFAILIRSNLKGRGLGWALMQLIIEYATSEGLKVISGQIMHENSVMIDMCRELGFEVKADPMERDIYNVTLTLAG
jgi:acetyltransferase